MESRCINDKEENQLMPRGNVYFKASLSMLFWALTFVWIKYALELYRPHEIVFMRLFLAAAVLFGVKLIRGHWEKLAGQDFRRMMLVALCEPFLYFIGEANGMQYVSPTLGSLVISVIPLVTALGAWIFLKEKVTHWLLLGLVVSFAGVAVMSMDSADLHGTMKGLMFLTLAVFAGMGYAITVKPLTHKYGALTIVAWQSFFGMLYFIPLFLIFDLKHFIGIEHQMIPMVSVIGMSLVASVGAFLLYTGVIRDLGVIRANIMTNLIPVFTVIMAFIFLGEGLNLRSGTGLGLALAGLFISQYPDLRKLHQRMGEEG